MPKVGSVFAAGTENFITERVHIICKLNLYIDVIYNLNIVDCLFRVLEVVLHCIRVHCNCIDSVLRR